MKDNSFDMVFCHNVLEYIDDKEQVVKEPCRVLKPGGVISIVKHNRTGRFMQMAVLLENFAEEDYSGMDEIISVCLNEKSKNPITILEKMMSRESCPMHGPIHHVMVGAALLTAYKNAGGEVELASALSEMNSRAMQVPGGACGLWGACGAGISTGTYMSIITKSTPLAEGVWGLCNQMTARTLNMIGQNGGPRCCKRDSYLATMEAVRFTEEKLGVKMELEKIVCSRSNRNEQCIQDRCPFYVKEKMSACKE